MFMIQTIEHYFLSLQESVKVKVNETAMLLKDLETIHARMRKILEELATLDDNLHSNSPATIPTIRKVFSLDAGSLQDSFMAELDSYNSSRKRTDVEILFDESKIFTHTQPSILTTGKFKQLLNETIRVDRNVAGMNSGYATLNLPKTPPPAYPISVSRTVVQDSRMRSQPVDYAGLSIRDPNRPNKPLLHFFQSGSKNLHLISIPTLQQKVIPLRMSFNIPHFHKSILTSSGEIILTGGTMDDNTERKNKFISKYDTQRQIFIENFATAIERSSHSLCEGEGFIYIIGGFGKQGGERIMERLNPRSGDVEREAASKYSGPNLSVYLSASKSILKLSEQGAEVYNIGNKVWKQIYIPQYIYYESCAGVEVNENEVFIFGGYTGENEGGNGVRFSHVIDVSDRNNLSLVMTNVLDLPTAEGFWNNIPLIYKREMYVLQNIESEESSDCLEHRRRLLKFNGSKWDVLFN